jgi:hypothetical protein
LLDFANSRQLDPRITFTRSTTATYYDGVTTAKAEENLFTYSQEFDNAAWTKALVTITANATTAPDGTSTADLAVANTTNGDHSVIQSFTFPANTTLTISCYMKAAGYDYGVIRHYSDGNGDVWASFNLSTGAVDSNSSGVTASITSVGSSWYRCVMTKTYSSATSGNSYGIRVANAGGIGTPFAGNGTSGIYIWGAQLEQRSSATAYTATTTQAITNYIPKLLTAGANQPRFDHNPTTGESLGFLIEEQRTNLVTYSEDLSNAAWSKIRSSIVSNTIIAPDGTLTGDKLVEDSTASNTHFIVQNVPLGGSVDSSPYTFSVYAKAGERTRFQMYDNNSNTSGVTVFNLSSGTVVSGTGKITSVGNGWYRCSIYPLKDYTTSSTVFIFLDNGSTTSYTGNGNSGIYIWGGQLELGTFITSYIPTTNASATRAADFAVMQGVNFSSWFNAGEGTIIYNTSTGRYIQDGRLFWQIDNNISGYYQIFYAAYAVGGNYYPPTVIPTGSTSTGPNLNAFAFDTTSVAVSTNGSTAVTGSGLTYNFSSAARFMFGTGNVPVSKMAFYPKKLTNINIQSLTA